jgi:hypothetical protein
MVCHFVGRDPWQLCRTYGAWDRGGLSSQPLRAGLTSAAPPSPNGGEWRGTVRFSDTNASVPKPNFIFRCLRAFGSRQESGRHLLVVTTLADGERHVYWSEVQDRRAPVLFKAQHASCNSAYRLRLLASADVDDNSHRHFKRTAGLRLVLPRPDTLDEIGVDLSRSRTFENLHVAHATVFIYDV